MLMHLKTEIGGEVIEQAVYRVQLKKHSDIYAETHTEV